MRKVGIISKNQRNNKERTWKQYEKGKKKGKNGERESVSHSVQLCETMNCRPPGSSVHRIIQARILECVVMPFSKRSSQLRD